MGNSGNINIKELAQRLNLSKSTVSRAFRGHSDINLETKERILKVAKELNYQPNHHASNLRAQKSKNIPRPLATSPAIYPYPNTGKRTRG